jgi:hypothetical protein
MILPGQPLFDLYGLNEEVMDTYHFAIMEEPNVTKGQYHANCFVSNYTGEISDLWKWNKQSNNFKLVFIE